MREHQEWTVGEIQWAANCLHGTDDLKWEFGSPGLTCALNALRGGYRPPPKPVDVREELRPEDAMGRCVEVRSLVTSVGAFLEFHAAWFGRSTLSGLALRRLREVIAPFIVPKEGE